MLIRKCPKCGKYYCALNWLPITKNNDGTYRFELFNPKHCPNCGALYNNSKKEYQKLFEFIGVSSRLNYAISLFLDGHFDSAIREASIVLETLIKEKSGLDEHGAPLAGHAFKFDAENPPIIALNDLETESEQNEQKGIQLMIQGFLMSIRNIAIHNSIGHGSLQAFEIICFVDFFIKIIDGNSFAKRAYWKKSRIGMDSIVIPKRLDRLKFRLFLKLHSIVAFFRGHF